ncbi:THAP domain-containing protein 3 [Diachasma alloeum]|uniref:THAP domain-containing protein 3 n=1 Tax=Diachasma alloeum TaxID=454923 RepID=UPI0007382AF4|nr:THAP domain-containing protein 3 [Diachasma alloeum]
MVRCEYCKKKSTKWKQLSFHRFPKDEMLKTEWINRLGRTNWRPKEWCALCSEHFATNCIDFRDKVAKLRKGSIPTIFEHDKDNQSVSEHSSQSIDNPKKLRKIENEEGSSKDISDNNEENRKRHKTEGSIPRSPSTGCSTNGQERNGGRTPLEALTHDHTYAHSLEVLERKLSAALSKIDELARKNKLSSQKETRAVKKLKKVKDALADLRRTHQILQDSSYHLDGFENIPTALFKRMNRSMKQGSLTKDKYPAELRVKSVMQLLIDIAGDYLYLPTWKGLWPLLFC